MNTRPSKSRAAAFARAVKACGGRPRDLMRAINDAGLGVTVFPQHIHNWKTRGVSPGAAVLIEKATGGKVTRHQLLGTKSEAA